MGPFQALDGCSSGHRLFGPFFSSLTSSAASLPSYLYSNPAFSSPLVSCHSLLGIHRILGQLVSVFPSCIFVWSGSCLSHYPGITSTVPFDAFINSHFQVYIQSQCHAHTWFLVPASLLSSASHSCAVHLGYSLSLSSFSLPL